MYYFSFLACSRVKYWEIKQIQANVLLLLLYLTTEELFSNQHHWQIWYTKCTQTQHEKFESWNNNDNIMLQKNYISI
jgi:hypothetical protein